MPHVVVSALSILQYLSPKSIESPHCQSKYPTTVIENWTFAVFWFTTMIGKGDKGLSTDDSTLLALINTQMIQKKTRIIMSFTTKLPILMNNGKFRCPCISSPPLDHHGPLPMSPGGHYQHCVIPTVAIHQPHQPDDQSLLLLPHRIFD